jgi:argininosuccinate lyase
MGGKLWGGRFSSKPDAMVDSFHASIGFDKRLWREDIESSMAYCRMLAKQGIIGESDSDTIVEALREIHHEMEAGTFAFDESLEDIHTHIEDALVRRVGPLGEALYTGRSRNDQIALDTRLYVRNAIAEQIHLLTGLQSTLVELAENNQDLVMPGYTHLQRAQPVLLAHHLLAYYEMLKRDRQRLEESRKRASVLTIGSAALSGTTFDIDRDFLCRELSLETASANSMDAVSDRDFVVECIFCSAVVMTHLSRLCEELIMWSSQEFAFVEISESFATGSSIMPQKKNPDIPELIRGKTGRVYGHLTSLLTTMKGLPLTYNKDMQEDKEALFDTVDTVAKSLTILSLLLKEVAFKGENMLKAIQHGYLAATDLADYLVGKGITFRKAHQVVGDIIRTAEVNNKELHQLDLEEMKTFTPIIDSDVYEWLDPLSCIKRRNIPGGTGPEAVKRALGKAREELQS